MTTAGGWRARLEPRAPLLLVVAVALAGAASGLGNRFAYDDRWIILHNARLHDLGRAWRIFGESYWPILSNGLYRPLVSLGYALQWAAGGGSPLPFHVVNVLLKAAAAVAVFRLATRALPTAWPAFATALLFAAHPVHVEAVGNIVGQAELLCTLLLVGATTLYVAWRADGRLGADPARPAWGRVLALAGLYALATLAKEQGIVLPALLAAAEATVVADARGWRARVAAWRPVGLVMLVVAIALLAVRLRVLGQLGGDAPHPAMDHMTMRERTVAMLGLAPTLLRLLVWPRALSADYGPSHVEFIPQWTPAAALGVAVLVGVLALAVVTRRRAPAVTLGVLWVAVTWAPVSNVLFPSGILLAERTLFAPSVGVVLMAGGLLAWAARAGALPATGGQGPLGAPRVVLAPVALLVALGTLHSALRQPMWKDNATLFTAMVAESPRSSRAWYALGGHYFETGQRVEGEQAWRRAIALDSTSHRVNGDLADRYREAGLCGPAIPLYAEVLQRRPYAIRARRGLALCEEREGAPARAARTLRAGFAHARAAGDYRLLRASLGELRERMSRPGAAVAAAAPVRLPQVATSHAESGGRSGGPPRDRSP